MHKNIKVAAVIPARYHSTRFEGKPLALIEGKPMIFHVYENTKKCRLLDEVVVATDDERIQEAVLEFGGKVILTSKEHPTGTDRVAEAAKYIEADIIVNVQGDEPLVNIKMIEQLVLPLLEEESINVTNLIARIENPGDFIDATVVKAAKDKDDFLLYLTRSPIPYPRTRQNYAVYQHIGVYAFRKSFLLAFAQMPQSPLELIEGIEFLRIIENGYKVKAILTDHRSIGVDTISDLLEVEKIIKKSHANIPDASDGK